MAELEGGFLMGADSLGEKGKPAEKVGREAAEILLSQFRTGAPVDMHLADQLVVWMGLADGVSRIRTAKLSLHTLTAIEICKRFLNVEFRVEGKLGEAALITCHGASFTNKFLS